MLEIKKDLDIMHVDSFKVYAPYMKLYITRKLIEIGVDVSNSGFNYFRDVLVKMMGDGSKRRTLREYYMDICNGNLTINQIDKAITFTLNTSYIKSNGFSKLNDFMGGNVITRPSNAKISYIVKEYLRFCLYDDYTAFMNKKQAR